MLELDDDVHTSFNEPHRTRIQENPWARSAQTRNGFLSFASLFLLLLKNLNFEKCWFAEICDAHLDQQAVVNDQIYWNTNFISVGSEKRTVWCHSLSTKTFCTVSLNIEVIVTPFYFTDPSMLMPALPVLVEILQRERLLVSSEMV